MRMCLAAATTAGLGLLMLSLQAISAVDPDVIAQGRYLARAADCYQCHTAEGGVPYAGGRPLHTPFGTIYSTNITPDETGIGDYSAEEFYHLLHTGEAPDGHQVYPAMPYTSYHYLTRADTKAMYHYLMSLEPVKNVPPETDLSFPYDQRWGLIFWNLLFADSDVYEPNSERSEVWNRGRYLATALGHCGQCHTPRGFMGSMDTDRYLMGGQLGRIWPPNITADALVRRGWTADKLKAFLKSGLSQLGAANGEMFPAVMHGTHYFTDKDINALVTYLLAGADRAEAAPSATAQQDAKPDTAAGPGRLIYMNLCAGCHRANGSGIPHVTVPLVSSSTLHLEGAHNLIAIILDGIPLQDFPGYARMQSMPGFAQELTNTEIAQLVNYLRTTWGSGAGKVSADAVAALRVSHTAQ